MISTQAIRMAIRAKSCMPDITIRAQGKLAGVSHQSMMRLNQRCEQCDLDMTSIESLNDSELMLKLYPSIARDKAMKRPPNTAAIITELTKPRGKRKTKTVLYLEYVVVNPATAMSRTHFFRLVNKALKCAKLSMRQIHVAGEVVYIDYAGTQVFYTEKGKKTWVKVFVAVLGASKKLFAWATYGEKTEHWIDGMTRMFEYYGGVTSVVSMDNAKALVTKPGLFCNLTDNVTAFGFHYGCIMDTCRIHHPQDKSLVEVGVKFITQRILVPSLQNNTFFSLAEINQHLAEEVDKLNDVNFQGLKISRNDLFRINEKNALRPLPANPYTMIVARLKQKVPPNYHIKYLKHEYSVPHLLRGLVVDVYVDQSSVRIVHEREQVASHDINLQPFAASTQAVHMPAEHIADMASNDKECNLSWASTVGSPVRGIVDMWYEKTANPASRAIGKRCKALKKLHQTHGASILSDACAYASRHGMHSPSDIRLIISAQTHNEGFDSLPTFNIAHTNVRGAQYFGGYHEA